MSVELIIASPWSRNEKAYHRSPVIEEDEEFGCSSNLSSNIQDGRLPYSDSAVKFTGSQINYYFICKRKLWFFSHNIELEPESDLVKLGRLLHENSYKRKMKEVQIDRIKVDFLENKRVQGVGEEISDAPTNETPALSSVTSGTSSSQQIDAAGKVSGRSDQFIERGDNSATSVGSGQKEIVIHEVKRSKKMQDAHLYQLLYYMYFLRRNYGVNVSHGVLHYPLLKQNLDVPLSEDRIKQVEEAIRGIASVNAEPRPPEAVMKGYCRSCAYQDLCWG